MNSFWPLNKDEIKKRRQEKRNMENRKELEKVIEEMIFYYYKITEVKILQISNFKQSENEKTYLINLVRIWFFDSLHRPLKEINHIISKREINPKEFKEDNFKQNTIEIVLNLNKNFDGIYIERKENKENCLIN